jgi:HK97 family phage major capsid protein
MTSTQEAIAELKVKRAKVLKQADKAMANANKFNRAPSQAESLVCNDAMTRASALNLRISELELRETRANEGMGGALRTGAYSPARVTDRGNVYERGDHAGPSFFRDLYTARTNGDHDARKRLEKNNRQVLDAKKAGGEQRAVSTVFGNAGELVPPKWLEDEFVKFVRPGRITANLCRMDTVPAGTDQINIPKIATGTVTAVQSTQNTGIQQTDITTTSVASPVITIAGGQTVSLQLLEQSPLNIDELILQDLAADYAKQWDLQVLVGTGTSGQVTGLTVMAGTTAVTWTQATPALGGAGGLYAKIAACISAINSARFAPPDAIIMHPRRWAWAESQSDGNNRPLIVPTAGLAAGNSAWNASATATAMLAEGLVGSMLGLPVFIDANISVTGGAGSNQDYIIVARMSDIRAYESQVRAEAFQQTYAQNMSVLCRLYAYAAFIPNRYPQSVGIITGSGAITPTF